MCNVPNVLNKNVSTSGTIVVVVDRATFGRVSLDASLSVTLEHFRLSNCPG